jgi:4'-phosphopantetheinyl transferase EntD
MVRVGGKKKYRVGIDIRDKENEENGQEVLEGMKKEKER